MPTLQFRNGNHPGRHDMVPCWDVPWHKPQSRNAAHQSCLIAILQRYTCKASSRKKAELQSSQNSRQQLIWSITSRASFRGWLTEQSIPFWNAWRSTSVRSLLGIRTRWRNQPLCSRHIESLKYSCEAFTEDDLGPGRRWRSNLWLASLFVLRPICEIDGAYE